MYLTGPFSFGKNNFSDIFDSDKQLIESINGLFSVYGISVCLNNCSYQGTCV